MTSGFDTRLASSAGLTLEEVERALRAAVAAPSSHNSQPWRFGLTPRAIEVFVDRTRLLPVADPDSREARMACGAALLNVRIAIAAMGHTPVVEICPDRRDPDLMARIQAGDPHSPLRHELELSAAIARRRTDRHPFHDMPVPASATDAMRRAVEAEGCWMHVVESPLERDRLRELIRVAHRTQMQDPAFVRELKAWTGHDGRRPDGVPASAGGPRPEFQDMWPMREFAGKDARVRRPGRDFEQEPLIIVIGTFSEGRHDHVRSGQAMQRLLLTATVDGLAASFFAQPVEIPSTRDELRRLVRAPGTPAMVLRIGYGEGRPATPRRHITDALLPVDYYTTGRKP